MFDMLCDVSDIEHRLTQPSLVQRSSREDEPHPQGGNRSVLPLRLARPSNSAVCTAGPLFYRGAHPPLLVLFNSSGKHLLVSNAIGTLSGWLVRMATGVRPIVVEVMLA